MDHSEQRGMVPESVTGLFMRVASRYPHKTAIKADNRSCTYQQLDQLSSQIGRQVDQTLGERESPVALFLADGIDTIASMLGVLRSGHFYSVLSPALPPEDLSSKLIDLDAALVITDPELDPQVRPMLPSACKVIRLEDAAGQPSTPLNKPICPDSVAAIYYTSGSTGEPKGVMRLQEAILQHGMRELQAKLVTPDDGIILVYALSASASLSAVFLALFSGATLTVIKIDKEGFASFQDSLETDKITMIRCPVEVMRSFLDSLPPNAFFPDIRSAWVGGDVLYRRDVEHLRRHIPDTAVIVHNFGTSETSTLARNIIRSDTPLDSEIVPVGYPFKGKEIIILNDDGKQAQAGEVGDICVRGELQIPGYWRKPGLTDEKFIVDPDDPNRRIYSTGDRGRFRPDGQLELAGRKDFRVKIRGFSVDMSAIESVLSTIPEIQRAVVVSREDPAGRKNLIAYVTLFPGEQLLPRDMREQLGSRMPAHMIPNVFVILDTFPLSANGKVNRKALPVPDSTQLEQGALSIKPRDALEEDLLNIWSDTLKVEPIGIQTSFFELGGDSLSAVSMFLEVEHKRGLRLPPSLLIGHETIEKLAEAIRNIENSGVRSLVTLQPNGDLPPLFLVPGIFGDVMVWKQALPYFDARQPLYGLQALREGGDSLFNLDVKQAASIFIKDVKYYQPEGPYYLTGYSFGGLVAFEMGRQLEALGDRVAFLGLVDTSAPGRKPQAPWGTRLRLHLQNLRDLSWEQRPGYINERINRFLLRLSRRQGLRKAIPVRKLIGRSRHRATSVAIQSYFPDAPYFGPVTIFKAIDIPWYVNWDRMKGWPGFVKGEIRMIDLPGSHTSIIKGPFVGELVQKMQAWIARAGQAV